MRALGVSGASQTDLVLPSSARFGLLTDVDRCAAGHPRGPRGVLEIVPGLVRARHHGSSSADTGRPPNEGRQSRFWICKGPSTWEGAECQEPLQGFEPWTYALRKHRSTAELRWHARPADVPWGSPGRAPSIGAPGVGFQSKGRLNAPASVPAPSGPPSRPTPSGAGRAGVARCGRASSRSCRRRNRSGKGPGPGSRGAGRPCRRRA